MSAARRAPARRVAPVDPRLLRYAASTRRFLVLAVAIGAATALLLVAQAFLVATVVAGAFVDHRSLASLRWPVVGLAAVVAGRGLLSWSAELAAYRASASAKSELRRSIVGRMAAADTGPFQQGESGRLAVLAGFGVDALDGYYSRYLPQLFLAVIVPVTVVLVVAGADWISAVIMGVTVPLIPLFMGLVGAATGERTARRLRSLDRLAGHFLDVVAGLPTLKVFGRAKAQAKAIADTTDRYRAATVSTLRLTFLSSLVLELLATVSVALVAVAVGLRLLGGHIPFRDALFVLVLAPEAYIPLRQLAAHFHASADGMKAAEGAFELLGRPSNGSSAGSASVRGTGIDVSGLAVTYQRRRIPALVDLDLRVEEGETVAITGPSGCGKSTLLNVLLGLQRPSAGTVRIGGVELGALDLAHWRAMVGWVPQRPHIFARSVADNVRLGRSAASDDEVLAALEAAELGPVVRALPAGLDTMLGEGGFGLSAGERQRLALARAFVRDAPVVLLDEPTANLDGDTEAEVIEAVRRLTTGRTTIVVAHRPALAAVAHRVVAIGQPGMPP